MIQRIQTLWLFLAAIFSALLMIDWYTGYVYTATVPQVLGGKIEYLAVRGHFVSMLLAVAMIILPLITIFFFKNRKRQRMLGLLSVLITIGFIAVNLMRIENFKNSTPAPQDGSYHVGMVIPVVVIVFIMFAISGIRKDEKLVKSMDRLR